MKENDHTGFCKGFVGVAGAFAEQQSLSFAPELRWDEAETYAGQGLKVLSHGWTTPTCPLQEGTNSVFFRGRPFSLSGQNNIANIDLGDRVAVSRELTDLDSKFSLCVVGDQGRLILATDMLGAGGIYYARHDGRLYFASHLGLLLRVLPREHRRNRRGAASMLAAFGTLDGTTHVEGVRRLMGCETLSAAWGGDRDVAFDVHTYARLEDLLINPDLRYEHQPDAAESAYHECWRNAIAREGLLDHPDPIVLLTGGRDSRAIAWGVLEGKQNNLRTMTFGSHDSIDLARAKRVAKKMRVPHHTVPEYDQLQLSDYAGLVVALGGGGMGLDTTHMVPCFAHASQQTSLIAMGYLGTFGTGYPPRRGSFGYPYLQKAVLHELYAKREAIASFFPEEVEWMVDYLKGQWDALDHLEPFHRLVFVERVIRQGAYISSVFDAAEYFVETAYPFYNRPLLSLVYSQPFDRLRDCRFYDRCIAQLAQRVSGQGAMASVGLDWRLALGRRWNHGRIHYHRMVKRGSDRLDYRKLVSRSSAWIDEAMACFGEEDPVGDFTRDSLKRWEGRALPTAKFPLAFYGLSMGLSMKLAQAD